MSDVTKPRPASATPQASHEKSNATTVCRKATPEETRALLGKGWIVPVPRPQASPAKNSPPPASEPQAAPQADKGIERKP